MVIITRQKMKKKKLDTKCVHRIKMRTTQKVKKDEFIHSFVCVSFSILRGLYNLRVSVHCVSYAPSEYWNRWRDTASLSVNFLFFFFSPFGGRATVREDGRWQKQIAPPDK